MPVQRKLNYEERLLCITRNFVVYKRYGEDVMKAANVVNKYFPSKSQAACKRSMEYFVKAYQDGIDFVEDNKAGYWEANRPSQLVSKEKVFFASHGNISSGILYGMLYDIFNWYHER